jgi:hypothetical protein
MNTECGMTADKNLEANEKQEVDIHCTHLPGLSP